MENKNEPVSIQIPKEHYVENLHNRITKLEERSNRMDKCIESSIKILIEFAKELTQKHS